MNIKCRYSGLKPDCAVIVATGGCACPVHHECQAAVCSYCCTCLACREERQPSMLILMCQAFTFSVLPKRCLACSALQALHAEDLLQLSNACLLSS